MEIICLGGHRGKRTPSTTSQNTHKQIKEVVMVGGSREESKSGEKEGERQGGKKIMRDKKWGGKGNGSPLWS